MWGYWCPVMDFRGSVPWVSYARFIPLFAFAMTWWMVLRLTSSFSTCRYFGSRQNGSPIFSLILIATLLNSTLLLVLFKKTRSGFAFAQCDCALGITLYVFTQPLLMPIKYHWPWLLTDQSNLSLQAQISKFIVLAEGGTNGFIRMNTTAGDACEGLDKCVIYLKLAFSGGKEPR